MRVETIEVVDKFSGATHNIRLSDFSAVLHDIPGAEVTDIPGAEVTKKKVTKKKASKKKASKKTR